MSSSKLSSIDELEARSPASVEETTGAGRTELATPEAQHAL